MNAAQQIEQAIAELTKAKSELNALIQAETKPLLMRALESIEDRIHEALVKLGG
jgi:hypothetical protein